MHEKKYPLLDNPRDPRFLALRFLQTPQGRSRTGLYIIEGIRHVARAIDHNARIDSIFMDPSVLSNRFGQKLVRKLRKTGTAGVRLAHPLYKQLTLAAEPQGIGAVAVQHWTSIAEVRPQRDSFFLGVEALESPGNLGTIIRTAEATGAAGILFLEENPDPWDPATVRATMGSLFSQKLIRCSVHELSVWAKAHGVAVIASSPRGLLDYRSMRFRWPAVLVVGSEKRGLTQNLMEVSDFTLRIPTAGHCDSVNVSVAAGVLLFEMFNRRRGA